MLLPAKFFALTQTQTEELHTQIWNSAESQIQT